MAGRQAVWWRSYVSEDWMNEWSKHRCLEQLNSPHWVENGWFNQRSQFQRRRPVTIEASLPPPPSPPPPATRNLKFLLEVSQFHHWDVYHSMDFFGCVSSICRTSRLLPHRRPEKLDRWESVVAKEHMIGGTFCDKTGGVALIERLSLAHGFGFYHWLCFLVSSLWKERAFYGSGSWQWRALVAF